MKFALLIILCLMMACHQEAGENHAEISAGNSGSGVPETPDEGRNESTGDKDTADGNKEDQTGENQDPGEAKEEVDKAKEEDTGNQNITGVEDTASNAVDNASWQAEDAPHGISVLYSSPDGFALWAGTRDGYLYKTVDQGGRWQEISQTDGTAVTALLELSDGCPGMLFVGTRGGNLFRSTDGGRHFSALDGRNYPLAFFTTDKSNPLDNPSAITMVLSHPSARGQIFIGHQAGITRLVRCDSNSALDFKTAGSVVPLAGAVYDGNIFVLDENDLYFSADGDSWELIDSMEETAQWVQASDDTLLAGTPRHIWFYDGSQWRRRLRGRSDLGFKWGQLVWIANRQTIFSSINMTDWQSFTGLSGRIRSFVLHADGFETKLWAVTDTGEIFSLILATGVEDF